jgi:hypothetical protein
MEAAQHHELAGALLAGHGALSTVALSTVALSTVALSTVALADGQADARTANRGFGKSMNSTSSLEVSSTA